MSIIIPVLVVVCDKVFSPIIIIPGVDIIINIDDFLIDLSRTTNILNLSIFFLTPSDSHYSLYQTQTFRNSFS